VDYRAIIHEQIEALRERQASLGYSPEDACLIAKTIADLMDTLRRLPLA